MIKKILFPIFFNFPKKNYLQYLLLFQCNIKRIVDYPNIQKYLKELYQLESFKSTTNFDHIKKQYHSNEELNPTKIIPLGPILDLNTQ